MGIRTSSYSGIIARKSERTQAFIAREFRAPEVALQAPLPQASADDIERLVRDDLNHEADLVGFSVAMNELDLKRRSPNWRWRAACAERTLSSRHRWVA